MGQIDIRGPLESPEKMQVRRGLNDAAAIAREKMVVKDGSINLHDVAGFGLDEERFKVHALLGSFPESLIVKAFSSPAAFHPAPRKGWNVTRRASSEAGRRQPRLF